MTVPEPQPNYPQRLGRRASVAVGLLPQSQQGVSTGQLRARRQSVAAPSRFNRPQEIQSGKTCYQNPLQASNRLYDAAISIDDHLQGRLQPGLGNTGLRKTDGRHAKGTKIDSSYYTPPSKQLKSMTFDLPHELDEKVTRSLKAKSNMSLCIFRDKARSVAIARG